MVVVLYSLQSQLARLSHLYSRRIIHIGCEKEEAAVPENNGPKHSMQHVQMRICKESLW